MLQQWLDLLCTMLPDVDSALARYSDGSNSESVTWPHSSREDDAVKSAIELAANQGALVTLSIDSGFVFARKFSKVNGVVGLKLRAEPHQRAAIEQLLQWGCTWFDLIGGHSPSDNIKSDALLHILRDLKGEDFDTVAQKIVDDIAVELKAERVSLGLGLKTGSDESIRLIASSNSKQIDRKLNLTAMMVSAMHEAAAHRGSVIASKDRNEHIAHQILREELEQACVVTVASHHDDDYWVLQLECDRQPSQKEIAGLEQFVSVIHLLLSALNRADKPNISALIGGKNSQRIKKYASRFRLIATTILAIILGLIFIDGQYDIKARATIEGSIQRAVVAPFDGFIEQSSARAGDIIEKNAILAVLDNSELKLELQLVENEHQEADRQYRRALAGGDRSESSILNARLDQIDARLGLLKRKLEQIQLRAPMDGVVISGDLTRALGAPVTRGDLLFEIAPLDAYRVVVHVGESDIDQVMEGQKGLITLSSHPNAKIPFVVEEITSVFNSRKDLGVVFETEGQLLKTEKFVRPGMEGYARINIGERSLGWILFHDVADWWRLKLWQYWP